MKRIVNILAITALLVGGCMSRRESSSQGSYDFAGVDKVAIVAVEGALTSEAAKDQIADFFSMELLERGYAPIGRSDLRAQLREQEDDSESLTTAEAAVEVLARCEREHLGAGHRESAAPRVVVAVVERDEGVQVVDAAAEHDRHEDPLVGAEGGAGEGCVGQPPGQ